MRKSHSKISILLLVVFSVLTLKNLLPYNSHEQDDCNEIVHIHKFQMHRIKISTISDPARDSNQNGNDDDNCRSGKSSFSYSHFPIVIFEFFKPTFRVLFKVVSVIENRFKDPSLEPLRKPPKNS